MYEENIRLCQFHSVVYVFNILKKVLVSSLNRGRSRNVAKSLQESILIAFDLIWKVLLPNSAAPLVEITNVYSFNVMLTKVYNPCQNKHNSKQASNIPEHLS